MTRLAITVLAGAFASLLLCLAVAPGVLDAQPAPDLHLDAGPADPSMGTAPASATPPLPDPTVEPEAAIRYVRDVHEEDGIPAAIAIGLHMLGLVLIRYGKGKWLTGYWLAGVTAGTGIVLSVAGYLSGELTVMAVLISAIATIGQVLTANTGTPAKAGA